jgi:hypothetical protein
MRELARSEWRQQVACRATSTASTGWDFTPGAEVDQRIGTALDRIWRRILDANRFYRMSLKTPTSDAQGRYLTSDLSVSAGDAQERLYRVLERLDRQLRVRRQVRRCRGSFLTWQLARRTRAASRPVGASGGEAGTSSTRSRSKQSDRDALHGEPHPDRVRQAVGRQRAMVEFPEGFEDVGYNEAAADLLMKGAKETDSSAELRTNGGERMDEMLAYVARFTTKPSQVRYNDDASAWGTVTDAETRPPRAARRAAQFLGRAQYRERPIQAPRQRALESGRNPLHGIGGATKRGGTQRLHASRLWRHLPFVAVLVAASGTGAATDFVMCNGSLYKFTYAIPSCLHSWVAAFNAPLIRRSRHSPTRAALIASLSLTAARSARRRRSAHDADRGHAQRRRPSSRTTADSTAAATRRTPTSSTSRHSTTATRSGNAGAGGGAALVRTAGARDMMLGAALGESLALIHRESISRWTGFTQDDIAVQSGVQGFAADVGGTRRDRSS